MNNDNPLLAIVVPCYNEQETLLFTIANLHELLQSLISEDRISKDSFLYFVDDGSQDRTWDIISSESKKSDHLRGLKLAKNAGHQNALLAGMFTLCTEVDCCITIDADLQDDINVIPQMIESFKEGSEIVYGIRAERTTDTMFKRKSAEYFYSIARKVGLEIKPNHADFRLMSRKSIIALSEFGETNIFLRGICPKLGFKTADVYYSRKSRLYGETKYPLFKMISFAWNGISSFSVAPLRLSGVMGGVSLLIALFLSVSTFWEFLAGNTIPGWASTMIAILFLGSVQLISISVLGEYVGKIFTEVKKRPRYIVEEEL